MVDALLWLILCILVANTREGTCRGDMRMQLITLAAWTMVSPLQYLEYSQHTLVWNWQLHLASFINLLQLNHEKQQQNEHGNNQAWKIVLLWEKENLSNKENGSPKHTQTYLLLLRFHIALTREPCQFYCVNWYTVCIKLCITCT